MNNDDGASVPSWTPIPDHLSSAPTPDHLSSTSPHRPPSSTAVPLRFSRHMNSRRVRSFSTGDETSRRRDRLEAGERSSRRSMRSRRRRQPKKPPPALTKKSEFVTSLARNIDSLVLVQLASLYYMECNVFLFVPRAFVHYMYLTPQPEPMMVTTAATPNLAAIFIPNFIAILWHLIVDLPIGSEANRGYMYGGVIVDFIGQLPPTSKLVLLAFDIFILALQCLMLSVHLDREKLRSEIDPKRTSPLLFLSLMTMAASLDQAEHGVATGSRTEEAPNGPGPSRRSVSSTRGGENSSEDNLESTSSGSSGAETSGQPDAFDELVSGLAVIGDYNPVATVRMHARVASLHAAIRSLVAGEGRRANVPSPPNDPSTPSSNVSIRDRLARLRNLRDSRLGRVLGWSNREAENIAEP